MRGSTEVPHRFTKHIQAAFFVLWLSCLFLAQTAQAQRLPDFLASTPITDVFPGADRTGPVEGKPAIARVFAGNKPLGLVYLTTDVVNRDDPYQRAKLADNRLKALSELQRVTGEIEQAKKDISDIEEEARRANVPPGWLR